MSEAEYLALPEDKPYLEYVDGVVFEKPIGDRNRSRLMTFVISRFFEFERFQGGESGPEGRVRLPDRTGYRLPDAAYWAPGRDSGDDSLPSVCVEVRSPGQRISALRDKCRAFRRNGVDACWLIDPDARTVEVFDAERDGVTVSGGVVTTAVMPGFELDLGEMFGVLR